MFIFSKKQCDTTYNVYGKSGGRGVSILKGGILVKGLQSDRNRDGYAVTEVSKEEYDLLNAHPVFQRHRERGFLEEGEKLSDKKKILPMLSGKDPSALMTEKDLSDGKSTSTPNIRKIMPKAKE
jgi:hypothetical protein